MPKRPALTDSSFLLSIFKPKSNPVPSGLRRTKLSGTKDRSKRRLTSFNRMSAANQEVLKRTGSREAYLKGAITLPQAKALLRNTAVSVGLVKPLRPRPQRTGPPLGYVRRASLQRMIEQHLKSVLQDAPLSPVHPYNPRAIEKNIGYFDDNDFTGDMLTWDYGKVKYAGRSNSEYETVIDGATRNPFWYH